MCISLEALGASIGAVTFFGASQASEHFPRIKRTRGDSGYRATTQRNSARHQISSRSRERQTNFLYSLIMAGTLSIRPILRMEGRSFITPPSLWKSFRVRKGAYAQPLNRRDRMETSVVEMTRRERLRPSANLENNTRQSSLSFRLLTDVAARRS